jgi:hypothetical protein
MTEHEFKLALPYHLRRRAQHGPWERLELELQQPDGQLKPAELPARPMRPQPLHT